MRTLQMFFTLQGKSKMTRRNFLKGLVAVVAVVVIEGALGDIEPP